MIQIEHFFRIDKEFVRAVTFANIPEPEKNANFSQDIKIAIADLIGPIRVTTASGSVLFEGNKEDMC